MKTDQAFSTGKLRINQEAKQLNFLLLAISSVALVLVVLVAGWMEARGSHYLAHSDGTLRADGRPLIHLDGLPMHEQRSTFLLGHWHERRW